MLTIEDKICSECGQVVRRGMTNESETFCIHKHCFTKYMNGEYGEGNWMIEEDDEDDYVRYYKLHYSVERGGMCTEEIVYKDATEEDEEVAV